MDAVHDAKRLAELTALPLDRKIQISQTRIIEWYTYYKGNVCVAFSGGKDSTVLLHLVRQLFPDVKAVFSNTGLEYPEIRQYATSYPNVDVVSPKMRFDQVLSTYGYPLIGKEVAEAIHYARRICSHNGQVERERERDHAEAERTTRRKRAELQGNRRKANASKCGGAAQTLIQTGNARARRSILQGKWNRRTGVNGPDGEGGVFSGTKELIGEKSLFNKEKWLPLVYTPILISHYCCQEMKKKPSHRYYRKSKLFPYIGTLAEESRIRKQAWIRHGCNAFEGSNPSSQPLSFWTEQDILAYIVRYGLDIASVYGDIILTDADGSEYDARSILFEGCGKLKCSGCQRTGCIFCAFGLHLEKGETRFQRLAKTHPKQYEYSIQGGQWVDNPKYDPTAPKFDGEWENWNPKKIWVPSKKGLGMGKVFDMVNEIYGKDFYRYE